MSDATAFMPSPRRYRREAAPGRRSCSVVPSAAACCFFCVAAGWLAPRGWGTKCSTRPWVRDPAKIDAIAAEVGTIDVPAELHPKAGVDIRFPIIDRTFLKAVVYTDEHQDQILAIGEFSESFAAVDEKRLRTRSIGPSTTASIATRTTISASRRRTPAKSRFAASRPNFVSSKGKPKSGHKLIRAMGEFEGHHGVGLLFLQLDGEENNLEQVEKILNSIR